jgi:aminoglycoside 3-N-acetyltransferase
MKRKNYFEKKIKNFFFSNLKKINIKKNDIVYLGLDLLKFYSPFVKIFPNYPRNKLNTYLCELFFNLLKEYISKNGTLIYPGFTWSFIIKKKFNKYKTSPEVGSFGNYIFRQKGIERSNHPINSLISWGKKKKIITNNHGSYSFGYNSPFNKFYELNVKFLNIGAPFYDTCTYIHHLEHLNGCNHRFYKLVEGKVYISNKFIKKDFFFLAKYKSYSNKIKRNEKLLYDNLLKKKKAIVSKKHNILFSSISTVNVLKEGMNLLNKNSSIFMKKNIQVIFNENNQTIKNKKNIVKIKYRLNLN